MTERKAREVESQLSPYVRSVSTAIESLIESIVARESNPEDPFRGAEAADAYLALEENLLAFGKSCYSLGAQQVTDVAL